MNTSPALQPGADSSEATAPTDLNDLVGYALRRVQMKVFQHLVECLTPYDLRPAQFSALAIIAQNPGPTQAELAKALNIEPPQVVPLLNKLEEAGLALRVRSKADKRSYGLYLSKAGEKLLKTLYGVAEESDRAATANLDDDERRQLLALLRKVY
ncbi:MarR family transcriptional regulator [Pseudomonas kermanshahensis]|jgi:DNA-binding MarR family transcriptional regulator|uniref:MarR family transcriptional regulator n=1 Tax=Pseudomonas kermanshahensis TaxID=2745482 RepID=A0ABU8R3D2_9PSED|nr:MULTISPECIES: MarR family transcriptional regulator [Pseudomonas]ATP44605.1 MarR family transcriptional regulator [Pseudomonas putida]MBC3488384.1 MarR family transcriptional regulator [Pseudomonas sp. SWRI50]MBC3497124.1 MarR family transcriptional regulator [Pseudomonas sp. SWRI67]MBV4527413.1 MarR family transcriptional regulator [Pseudomonas kermanshahensis]MCX2685464.1 MarR family transcriptional regulator [Pseudomonas sp. DCB_AW]